MMPGQDSVFRKIAGFRNCYFPVLDCVYLRAKLTLGSSYTVFACAPGSQVHPFFGWDKLIMMHFLSNFSKILPFLYQSASFIGVTN